MKATLKRQEEMGERWSILEEIFLNIFHANRKFMCYNRYRRCWYEHDMNILIITAKKKKKNTLKHIQTRQKNTHKKTKQHKKSKQKKVVENATFNLALNLVWLKADETKQYKRNIDIFVMGMS
jgi:hypothetical protein